MDDLQNLSDGLFFDPLGSFLSSYLTSFGVPWSRKDINENIPVLLLLYSVYNNYELEFGDNGCITATVQMEDDRILDRLTSWVRIPDCPWIKEAYLKMMAARDEKFLKETYAQLLTAIECVVKFELRLENNMIRMSSPAEEMITRRIAALLNSFGVSTVFDGNWRLVTLAKYLSRDIVYYASIASHGLGTFLQFFDSILLKVISNPESRITDPIRIRGKSEAAVLYGVCEYGYGENLSIEEILMKGRSLANHYFIYVTSHDDAFTGKEFLKFRSLCRIDSNAHFYFFVFDLKMSHNTVEYHYWDWYDTGLDIVQTVPYTEIQMNENYLNIEAYIHDEVKEGETLARLSELCLPQESVVDFESNETIQSGDMIPTYSMSSHLSVVCSPMFRPPQRKFRHSIGYGHRPGTYLHIGKHGLYSILECITRSDVPYQIDGDVFLSLPVDENKVSAEYLACVLKIAALFGTLISKKFPRRVYRRYRVAVTFNKEEQAKIVKSILTNCRDVVNSDGVYNVICVGHNLSSEERQNQLEEWNLPVKAFLESVLDEGGLKDFLSDKGRSKTVHAIIVDPSTDAAGNRLKGLRKALTLGKEKSIPVFVFSDLPQDTIEEDLDEDDFEYCRNGRLFDVKDNNSLRELATAIRDDLDKNGTLEMQLQARFFREFSAAKKVEELFGEKVPEKLTRFLISPNQSLNDLRVSMEALLRRIADAIAPGTDLGKTKGGWLAKFFLTGAREDREVTRKFYSLEGKLMEKTLATSVDFLYQILNGASHGDSAEEGNELNVLSYISESGTNNLSVAAIHIFMDFIVWLADTGGRFSASCTSRDSGEEVIPENLTGILRRGGKNEYYIETPADRYGNIHTVISKGVPIAVGSLVRVLAISEETRLRERYRWFATRWEPSPDNESDRKRERTPSPA